MRHTENRPTTTIVKTQDIGDVAIYAAHALGFWPSESLTFVSLRGPRRRCGLIGRVDLADLATHPDAVNVLIDALRRDDAAVVSLLIWSQTHTPDQAAALAEPLALALEAADLPAEVATIRHGQIHQHGSDQGRCATARPLPTDSPLVAALTGTGVAILPDRQALIDSLDGTPVPADTLTRATPATARRWLDVAATYPDPAHPLHDQDIADLLLSVQSVRMRDRLIASATEGSVPLALLVHLAQRAHPTHEGIYAAVAMTAWMAGRPVLAEAAIQRLPEDNSLGRLITQAMALHLPPTDSQNTLLGSGLAFAS